MPIKSHEKTINMIKSSKKTPLNPLKSPWNHHLQSRFGSPPGCSLTAVPPFTFFALRGRSGSRKKSMLMDGQMLDTLILCIRIDLQTSIYSVLGICTYQMGMYIYIHVCVCHKYLVYIYIYYIYTYSIYLYIYNVCVKYYIYNIYNIYIYISICI